jgi:N6-L-threonylcarbamoyladenine synthase
MTPFLTLGIETSCDDTGVALLEGERLVRSERLSSQITTHAPFGGVVPEYASRMHLEATIPLVCDVLAEGGVTDPRRELSLISVTAGPGLMGSLLVGVMAAKGLSAGWGTPILGVNHLEGHIFANVVTFPDLHPPFLCLIVSGGHTEIVRVRDYGDYAVIARTRDDAAGETYDKVAKLLNLGYPGGPVVDRLAASGDCDRFPFPVPLKHDPVLALSFSGLKTAVLWALRDYEGRESEIPVADVCASFQKAAIDAIVSKVDLAVQETGIRSVCLAGGVAANSALRAAVSGSRRFSAWYPPLNRCTDNAVMIAAAGYNAFRRGSRSSWELSADPSWELPFEELNIIKEKHEKTR